MAKIKGFSIYGPIVPNSTLDKYPTHIAKYGKGGFISVATKSDLLQVPSLRLEDGMMAYVVSDSSNSHFYQYINNSWNKCEFPTTISITNTLSDFQENAAEGEITVYNNKLYQLTVNNGTRTATPLPIYSVNSTSQNKTYNALFSTSDSDFNEDSDIALECGTSNKKNLKLNSNVSLELGDKVITENETANSISLPNENGTLALTSDIDDAISPIEQDITNIENNISTHNSKLNTLYNECNLDASGNGVHSYEKLEISSGVLATSGYGKFLTISRDTTNNIGYCFFINGIKKNNFSNSDKGFTELLGLNIGSARANDILYYVNGKDSDKIDTLWYIKSNIANVELYVRYDVKFSIKILTKTLSTNIVWENSLVRVNSDTGLTKATIWSDNSIINNIVENVSPRIQLLNYSSTFAGTKTANLNLLNYDTFIINSNNNEISNTSGKLVFNVDDASGLNIEESPFKFIFVAPLNYNYLRIKYNNNVVLDLSNLNLKDGEGLYVTPNNTNSWSYYRESSGIIPSHDETMSTMIDNNGNLYLHVNKVPREKKYYIIDGDSLSDSTSGISITSSNGNLDIIVPDDADIIDIRFNTFSELITTSPSSEKTYTIKSIKKSGGLNFPENHELEVFLDTTINLPTQNPITKVYLNNNDLSGGFAIDEQWNSNWLDNIAFHSNNYQPYVGEEERVYLKLISREIDHNVFEWMLMDSNGQLTVTNDNNITDLCNEITQYFQEL